MGHKKIGKTAVISGGVSNEKDVSLRSGQAVLKSLVDENVDAQSVEAKSEDLDELESRLKEKKIQTVFIALHGRMGEDGKIQNMLQSAKIAYTGSGIASSALCFNKLLANKILQSFNVLVPEYLYAGRSRAPLPQDLPFGFPAVVKPASGGSAIGVSIAKTPGELKPAVEAAFREDDNILIEKFIKGRELTVSVIGNSAVRILPVIEIKTEEEFYNYDAKYIPGKSTHILPARLGPGEQKKVENTAEKVYRLLGCRGFARIDLILSDAGECFVLDVNTIPGFTSTSLFPESAASAGISMGKLCRYLLQLAIEESGAG